MNDEQVARRVIRAVIQRARRMRYSIELLISPDDARALLRAWRFAEASGIQFVGDGIVAAGTRFRISPQMSDSKADLRSRATQALSLDAAFAQGPVASELTPERTVPDAKERRAA